MSNSYFEFKQFTVWHDKCAMKVGTDGVLLGAWVNVKRAKHVLDVGTGTGLITLILAQKELEAYITAIEIDPVAAAQAQENINRSPWKNRITLLNCDFRYFQNASKFDLIVSNPPYYTNALKSPDKRRNMARHADLLNYELLFQHSKELLSEDGRVEIIIPAEVEQKVVDTAWKYKLYLSRRLKVYAKKGKVCQRVLLAFSFQNQDYFSEYLYIYLNNNQFTPEYIALTKDFYLKM